MRLSRHSCLSWHDRTCTSIIKLSFDRGLLDIASWFFSSLNCGDGSIEEGIFCVSSVLRSCEEYWDRSTSWSFWDGSLSIVGIRRTIYWTWDCCVVYCYCCCCSSWWIVLVLNDTITWCVVKLSVNVLFVVLLFVLWQLLALLMKEWMKMSE